MKTISNFQLHVVSIQKVKKKTIKKGKIKKIYDNETVCPLKLKMDAS